LDRIFEVRSDMKPPLRNSSIMRGLVLVAALGALLTLGSCKKAPFIPEEPDGPTDPKDPDGTALRSLAEGVHFA
jgi:hypothetical protein